jgi:hypothetical protein
MQVQIIHTITQTPEEGRRILYADLACGNHSAYVQISSGPESWQNEVRVVVKNSSWKAWRGMGRKFRSVSESLAAYKTAAVREMIQTAAEIHAA